jgi:hypothetical protein
MKVAFALLVLSSSIIASAAIARNTKEKLRDNLAFCSQFVVQDPDPSIVLNDILDCCAFSQNVRDCQASDWGTFER